MKPRFGLFRRRRTERGSATVFVLGFAVVLFVGAGLVIDGGLALNERAQLADDLEQAARAGANEIDLNLLRDSQLVAVDPVAAQARATQYLVDRGYSAIQVSVAGNTVTTSAESSVDPAILSLVIPGPYTVSGTATATAVTGIA